MTTSIEDIIDQLRSERDAQRRTDTFCQRGVVCWALRPDPETPHGCLSASVCPAFRGVSGAEVPQHLMQAERDRIARLDGYVSDVHARLVAAQNAVPTWVPQFLSPFAPGRTPQEMNLAINDVSGSFHRRSVAPHNAMSDPPRDVEKTARDCIDDMLTRRVSKGTMEQVRDAADKAIKSTTRDDGLHRAIRLGPASDGIPR